MVTLYTIEGNRLVDPLAGATIYICDNADNEFFDWLYKLLHPTMFMF